MTDTKYGHQIKTFEFDSGGPGFYRQIARLSGDSAGVNATIEYGTYIAAGKIGKKPYKPIVSDLDQVLLWLGTDLNDLGELGAEVELCLGEKDQMEKHMFTCSSAVAIPKGMFYMPGTHHRVDRRFIFMKVSCGPENQVGPKPCNDNIPEPSKISGWFSKFNVNIMHIPFIRKGAWHYGPKNRDDAGGYISEINFKDDTGFRFNMSHESILKAPYRFGPVPDVPHVHNYDEFLLFMGADPDNLSELGGEIEVCVGKEEEKHIVTRPTAAIMPKGLPHCPVTITKVEKPFIFSVVRPFGPGKTTM